MAKLSPEELTALQRAYDVAKEYGTRIIPAGLRNPFLWSSRLWEAWELGDYLAEKGTILGDPKQWERGRGHNFRNANGFTYRLWYSKGGSFGIERAA